MANISNHTTCAFSHENRLTFGPGGCCPGPEDPLRWVLDDLLHFYIFFTNLKEFCRVQRKSEDNRNVPFFKKRSEGVHRREWKIYHSSTLQWEIFEWIYRHIDVNVDELWIYLFNGPMHKRTLQKKIKNWPKYYSIKTQIWHFVANMMKNVWFNFHGPISFSLRKTNFWSQWIRHWFSSTWAAI